MTTDLHVAIRLVADGGDRVRAELDRLVEGSAAGFARLAAATRPAAAAIGDVGAALSRVAGGGSGRAAVGGAGGGAAAATGAVVEGFEQMGAAGDVWARRTARAFGGYQETARAAAAVVERSLTTGLGTLEDAIVRFTQTGRIEWRGMVDSMLADLTRLVVRRSVTEPLATALGAALAGVFHDGGTVGTAPATRRVPAAAWLGAPRLHGGSVPWLGPNEVPAVLKRGELVLNRAQAAAFAAAASGAGEGRAATVINVDARGADDPEAVAVRVEAAVEAALARRLPAVVEVAAGRAERRVVDGWRRRGGRFGA